MLGNFTDPDVLDCPICCETLTDRVFQCENGHVACSSCCIKIGNKCPSCTLPIGYIRCRSIERILNSVEFSCQNFGCEETMLLSEREVHEQACIFGSKKISCKNFGCKETMLPREREVHEQSCIFGPCHCPIEGCNFLGFAKDLYTHFRGSHLRYVTQFDYKRPFRIWLKSASKVAILQEKTDGTIFILNQSNDYGTRAINLICIGSLLSKEEYCYELSVEFGGRTLKLRSVSAIILNWLRSRPRFENYLQNYLLVPTVGHIEVGVCIDKSWQ